MKVYEKRNTRDGLWVSIAYMDLRSMFGMERQKVHGGSLAGCLSLGFFAGPVWLGIDAQGVWSVIILVCIFGCWFSVVASSRWTRDMRYDNVNERTQVFFR